MAHKHIQTKANADTFCETKQNLRYSPITKAAFTLQVLMLISDFFLAVRLHVLSIVTHI